MRFKFWIRVGLKNSAIILGTCVFYTALMSAQLQEDDFSGILNTGAVYLLLFGSMFSMLLNTAAYQTYIPLALGFGSTRKEILLGLQCYRLIPTAILLPVTVVLFALSGTGSTRPWILLTAGLGIFLVFHGLGILMGVLLYRFGKTGLIVCSVAISFVIMGFGIGITAALNITVSFPRGMHWIALAAGTAAYGPMMAVEAKTIKRFTMKF